MNTKTIYRTLATLFIMINSFSSSANELFDPSPVWPLCGRIMDNPPVDWQASDGCPSNRFGNPAYADLGLSSTYGPRQKASSGYRYDFHRGIDIPAPIGTPVFAIAKGKVRVAGYHSSYSDPLVQLRHYRPNSWGSCTGGGGCYISNYMHMDSIVVSKYETVEKGQLIGYSGASASGFPHLHFEIRNAPGSHDPFSTWQRDAIHPFKVLPYPDQAGNNMGVTINNVDLSNPLSPIVNATVNLYNTNELDFEDLQVYVFAWDPQINDYTIIQQTTPGMNNTTPELEPYPYMPSHYHMTELNRSYSYKNSSRYPWSDFESSGDYESPFHMILPNYYSANIHLDQALPNQISIGTFNGLLIAPDVFNSFSPQYTLEISFDELIGSAQANDLCFMVHAMDVLGNASPWAVFHPLYNNLSECSQEAIDNL